VSGFRTAVSSVADNDVRIRGLAHGDRIRAHDFVGTAFLAIVGREPTDVEHAMISAVMVSIIDHGFVSVTTSAGRYIATGNPQVVPAVAGGLLAAGDNTLSPAASYDNLVRLRDEPDLRTAVDRALARRERIPGVGHPTHTGVDYRAVALDELADRFGVPDVHRSLMRRIADTVSESKGRRLPVNVDGEIAAIALDLGLGRDHIVAFVLSGVVPGLAAHVTEQIGQGEPLKYIENGRYEHEGDR
jgi:citrate synthase